MQSPWAPLYRFYRVGFLSWKSIFVDRLVRFHRRPLYSLFIRIWRIEKVIAVTNQMQAELSRATTKNSRHFHTFRSNRDRFVDLLSKLFISSKCTKHIAVFFKKTRMDVSSRNEKGKRKLERWSELSEWTPLTRCMAAQRCKIRSSTLTTFRFLSMLLRYRLVYLIYFTY